MILPASNRQRLLVSSPSESKSILTLQNVSVADSGEYTCCPALLDTANVNLQVLVQVRSAFFVQDKVLNTTTNMYMYIYIYIYIYIVVFNI